MYLFGIGKGSFDAVVELENLLEDRLKDGVVIDVRVGALKKVQPFAGTHPEPSEKNVAATEKIIQLLKESNEKSLVLFVIAGGGSALMTAPYKISVERKAEISKALMEAEADIRQLNVVRKHLSEIKGGRLAKLAYRAKIVSLIFSDVPGNDLSTIASGATVLDQSTSEEAEKILKKRGVWDKLKLEGLEFSETPKEEKYFEKVSNIIMQDPASVVGAMARKAGELGWKIKILGTDLEGEAGELGLKLLNSAQAGEVLLASGESSVEVAAAGVGGRNQHLVLANLKNIKEGQVIIAAASDGHDHSDSAGAVGDETSLKRAEDLGLNPDEFLARADSFEFFQRLGDSLETGLLESNVSDFYLVISP
ncbi:MAG: DUF4147 domain-containing protein [bacterium]|nr:DUF4147 domain-containing protein [bacterium]